MAVCCVACVAPAAGYAVYGVLATAFFKFLYNISFNIEFDFKRESSQETITIVY